MFTPAMLLKSSLERWAVEPLPDEAKLMLPGFALASATSSRIEFACTEGWVTRIIGLDATMPIGTRSRAGTTASFG